MGVGVFSGVGIFSRGYSICKGGIATKCRASTGTYKQNIVNFMDLSPTDLDVAKEHWL